VVVWGRVGVRSGGFVGTCMCEHVWVCWVCSSGSVYGAQGSDLVQASCCVAHVVGPVIAGG
jgi:hypothetical protein